MFELDKPEPGSIAEETLSPDERAELEQAEAAPETPDTPPQGGSEPTAAQGEQAAEPAPDDVPVPDSIARNPDDASNWRELRETARDFRKQAAERAAELKARDESIARMQAELAAIRAQQAAQPQQVQQPTQLPDPVEDPAGFRAQIAQHVSAEVQSARFDMSEAAAVARHGKDTVDAAFNAFQTARASDPGLTAAISGAPDPYGAMVAWSERRAMLAEIGDDPAAYCAKVEAEALEKARASLAAEAAGDKVKAVEDALSRRRVPSSIATAPGVGRNASQGAAWNGPAPLSEALNSPLDF